MDNALVGIDACKGGWMAIGRAGIGEAIHAVVIREISALDQAFPRPVVVGIDIPIGLTQAGTRDCDRLARQLLGFPRSSSVFPAPVRPALVAHTRVEADAINRRIDGRGVGVFSWALYPRIREVDEHLRGNPECGEIYYEVHPELAFMAWNDGMPFAASKKSSAGKAQRKALVSAYFGADSYSNVRTKFQKGKVQDDDILDSFAVLWSAERIHKNQHRVIPEPPQVDSEGLKMGIWF